MTEATGAIRGRRIIVVGAGIGGLAAAAALARRGADVTVLEQAEAIREVGAGLQISPNGAAVLRALGLAEDVAAQSVRASGVTLCDHRGGEVTTVDMRGRDFHLFHRADLIDLLRRAALAEGARVLLLQKVREVRPGCAPRIVLASGAEMGADVVIGADGLNSVTRAALNGVVAPFFTGQVAWRATIPNETGRRDDVRLHMGPHRHLVSYPLRQGRLLNLVAVQERAAWAAASWSQTDDPMVLRAAFADFGADVRGMLERVETVNLWGLFRHPVAPFWHAEGVTLLGDALHPTLPFMAQGANMALEDAWVLARALAEAGTPKAAFARYRTERETRVRRIVDAATGNARKYHLALPPVRWAAHAGLRLAGRLAPGAMMRSLEWIYGTDVTRDG
ncbi:FAD-dependent monooxygenase [Roseovarius sp. SCSIO 43702]|uniref:FAD-dependent monooxygenase n=1 Tax=Roseovarius sp. SCSIO 43702 TaxID=2823043 RepID=UPI001C7312BE|nr:FAD-dependent monooxygenase [Roseovarius sp. SCSIO 43702]QYX58433.1 FAD-dependent monooxygenase [Roseovarius sp. SCSIO 43702]